MLYTHELGRVPGTVSEVLAGERSKAGRAGAGGASAAARAGVLKTGATPLGRAPSLRGGAGGATGAATGSSKSAAVTGSDRDRAGARSG